MSSLDIMQKIWTGILSAGNIRLKAWIHIRQIKTSGAISRAYVQTRKMGMDLDVIAAAKARIGWLREFKNCILHRYIATMYCRLGHFIPFSSTLD